MAPLYHGCEPVCIILFSDTDIVLKLATLDLLYEALAVLQVTEGEVRVLAAARYYLRSPKLAKKFGDAGVERARAFVERVAAHTDEPPLNEQQCLLDAGLDSGEAVLLASALVTKHTLVATGDKRALKALASDGGCKPILRRLSGTVICLEEILLRIIWTNDFDLILPKVIAGYECDTAVRAAFGSGMRTSKANVVRSLESRIAELDTLTGGRLLWK